MRFIINDESFETDVDVRISLLDLLRDQLGLTGTPSPDPKVAAAINGCRVVA